MKAKDFDRTFDRGESIIKYLKLSAAKRYGRSQKRKTSKVTRHGIPTAALQTNPSFWRMIAKRRSEPTMSLKSAKRLMNKLQAGHRDACQRKGRFVD